MMIRGAAFGIAIALTAPAHAAGVREIGPADPLRKPVLDRLHREVDAAIAQPNQFVVSKLRQQGDWVYAEVTPQTPAGKPIDIAKSAFAELEKEGMLDSHIIYALLQRGKSGWTVRSWQMGPTDVVQAGWPEEFGVSHELVGLRRP